MKTSQPWTAQQLNDLRRHLKAKKKHLSRSKANDLLADLDSFRMGKILWAIQGNGRAGRGESILKELATKLNCHWRSLYNDMNLYRGARSEANIVRHPPCREYWQTLGSTFGGDDHLTFRAHRTLSDKPLLIRNGDDWILDKEKLAELGELASYMRKQNRGFNPKVGQEPKTEAALRGGHKLAQSTARLHAYMGGFTGREDLQKMGVADLQDRTIVVAPPRLKIPETVKGAIYTEERRAMIEAATKTSSIESVRTLDDRLILGRSENVLPKFARHSLDMILTDPPYGADYGHAWRRDLKVDHDAEPTAQDEAALVARIAQTILEKEIIKPNFVWLSFCPTALVPVFAAPLQKIFFGNEWTFDVLIWDKGHFGKTGGHTAFGRRAEAILYFSRGRPLSADHLMVSNIFQVNPDKKTTDHWKPVELLRQLIRLFCYGERCTVCDPFAGSASTGVAAILEGADYRLVESHKGQYALAKAKMTTALGAKTARLQAA